MNQIDLNDWLDVVDQEEQLRSQLQVSLEQYRQAITELLTLANMRCGSSVCAAYVLLSLYDGDNWKVDLADVCCRLDGHYFSQVLIAMRGRGLLLKEPHSVVQNGSQRFKALSEEWSI